MGNYWKTIKKEEIGDAILTGYDGKLNEMRPFSDIMVHLPGGKTVLDFGCGIGRNIYHLKTVYEGVVGYDLPPMIDSFQTAFKGDNVTTTSDWNIVKEMKFDDCLASLVFQHIPKPELESYLSDLQKMVKRLVLHSRTWQDFAGGYTLPIIEKYFDVIEFIDQRDPAKDNNVVIVDNIEIINPDAHFVAILTPKK